MIKFKTILFSLSLLMAGNVLQSCSNNDDFFDPDLKTALVTVRQTDDNGVKLVVDKNTVLVPNNMNKSPYKKSAVRALVFYKEGETAASSTVIPVDVNWLDSIRTKDPVKTFGVEDAQKYGDDPLEIVNDWVTVAEDNFLTLRIRTLFGGISNQHIINLVSGTNPQNPLEFVVRHDAQGDTNGKFGDGLVAFDLGKVSDEDLSGKTITIVWKSFEGQKKVDFVMDGLSDSQKPDGPSSEEAKRMMINSID